MDNVLFELVEAWRAFLFAPQSVAPLAAFRITFGCVLFASCLILWREADTWLTPDGVVPYRDFLEGHGRSRFTLFRLLPPTRSSAYLVLGLNGVASLALAVGLFTRISALVVFLTLVSLHHRNPLVVHSGDCVLRLMSFLLIFSDAGALWSIDSILWGERRMTAPWCQRLMQLQLSIVYFRAFAGKLKGRTWQRGSAIYYATSLAEHRRFPMPSLCRSGLPMRITAWTALTIELMLATLIWLPPLRGPMVAIGILFHLMIEITLNVQLFGWTMIVCLLLFLPPEQLDRLAALVGMG